MVELLFCEFNTFHYFLIFFAFLVENVLIQGFLYSWFLYIIHFYRFWCLVTLLGGYFLQCSSIFIWCFSLYLFLIILLFLFNRMRFLYFLFQSVIYLFFIWLLIFLMLLFCFMTFFMLFFSMVFMFILMFLRMLVFLMRFWGMRRWVSMLLNRCMVVMLMRMVLRLLLLFIFQCH